MGIKDLFKSDKERETELAKKRRRAFREAEGALDTVKDRGRKLQSERDKHWTQAKEYLKGGQKAAAQRCLQSVRGNELLLHKLQQKQWVFENLLTKLDLAKTDKDFADSLKAITTVVNIDPEHVDDVLAEVEDKLGEQGATDKIWDRMHSKEMEGVEGALTDSVPTLDSLMTDLEDEVADTQVEEAPARKTKSSRTAPATADTAKLRERARKIIDGNN
jgi:energy-converting hydrogenase A subunit M